MAQQNKNQSGGKSTNYSKVSNSKNQNNKKQNLSSLKGNKNSGNKTAGGSLKGNGWMDTLRQKPLWGVLILGMIIALIVIGVIAVSAMKAPSKANSSLASSNTAVSNFDAKNEIIVIEMKAGGLIKLELYPEQAPITVQNFAKLVQEKFYNGLKFHRVMKDFMIQGGDPKGNGTGGSTQTIKGEFTKNGVNNTLKHTRGVISMARSTDMNSASSQFFIMHGDSTSLDGSYAAFGKVIEGMDVVDAIANVKCDTSNPQSPVPLVDQIIKEIRIEKRS